MIFGGQVSGKGATFKWIRTTGYCRTILQYPVLCGGSQEVTAGVVGQFTLINANFSRGLAAVNDANEIGRIRSATVAGEIDILRGDDTLA